MGGEKVSKNRFMYTPTPQSFQFRCWILSSLSIFEYNIKLFMPLSKPYHRIFRPSLNSSCFSDPTWGYALDRRYIDPHEKSSLLSAAKLILKDFTEILEYVEPCDDNLSTYSHRIYELLLRTCTEVEASLEGILIANGYSKPGNRNLNIIDYRKVDPATKLTEYSVIMKQWQPKRCVRPFEAWKNPKEPLSWYDAYNKVKHDRSNKFFMASLDNLSYAICGLLCILYAQFGKEIGRIDNISEKLIFSIEGDIIEIGQFEILLPTFQDSEKYCFSWDELEVLQDPYSMYNF